MRTVSSPPVSVCGCSGGGDCGISRAIDRGRGVVGRPHRDDDVSLSVAGADEAAVAVSSGFKNKSAVANDIFVSYSA
ncbi:hypothetical protein ACI65C_010490 [Semiaphis heraclei]